MRILLTVLSCVGDAVMCTPVLQALHKHFPQASIDIMGDPRSLELFIHCPYRGELFCKDYRRKWKGYPMMVPLLRKHRYDVIVDLRTRYFSWLLRARKRITKQHAIPYNRHAIGRLMGVIHSLHGDAPIPHTCVWVGKEDKAYAHSVLATLPQGICLIFGPSKGTERPGDQWSPENYAALANTLVAGRGSVVLLGAAYQTAVAQAITSRLQVPFLDLTGKTRLLQAAAILQQATLFVGSDSGLGHIASAVGADTITTFGIGDPEEYMPWGSKAAGLRGANYDAANVPLADMLSLAQEKVLY